MTKKEFNSVCQFIEGTTRREFTEQQRASYLKVLGQYPIKEVMDMARKFMERPTPQSGYAPTPAPGDLIPTVRESNGPAAIQCRHVGCKRVFCLNPDNGPSIFIRNQANQMVAWFKMAGPQGEDDVIMESAAQIHEREHPDLWGPQNSEMTEW